MIAKHYYEAHVTIDPIPNQRSLNKVQAITERYNFRIASLLMVKGGERTPSTTDAFMTAHSKSLDDIKFKIMGLVTDLQRAGFVVRRYKIEDIVLDSRINDELSLLEV